jgi:hypothetical protein
LVAVTAWRPWRRRAWPTRCPTSPPVGVMLRVAVSCCELRAACCVLRCVLQSPRSLRVMECPGH